MVGVVDQVGLWREFVTVEDDCDVDAIFVSEVVALGSERVDSVRPADRRKERAAERGFRSARWAGLTRPACRALSEASTENDLCDRHLASDEVGGDVRARPLSSRSSVLIHN